MCIAVGDLNTFVSYTVSNRHRRKTKLDQERNVAVTQIVDANTLYTFELDEHYPINIEDCTDENGNQRKGVCFGSVLMTDLLSEWQRRKKDLADGKISKAEYTEWKLNWPKTTDDCGKHEPSKEWRDRKAT